MKSIFLGLGSNIGHRQANLRSALELLRSHGVSVLTVSPFFETRAVTPDRQPDYLNCACQVESDLSPESLLQHCLGVENLLGRIRHRRWAPRTIDLDILYFENWIVRTPTLTVPHPRLHLRRFVLEPLSAIAPTLRDPLSLFTVEEMLRDCLDTGWVIEI